MGSGIDAKAASIEVGAWAWHAQTRQAARVVDVVTLWGQTAVTVWLERDQRIETVRPDHLASQGQEGATDALLHRAAAARIHEALAEDLLLAPIQSSVTPLPHQLYALERAMAGRRVRHLFADEVGCGKTIEAGLVIRELKLRRKACRILVVAPRGLTPQWQAEMRLHFRERFEVVDPSTFGSGNPNDLDATPWTRHDQVICPLDSVKPLARRRGWSAERLADHNLRRFEDLVAAGWDLVVFDEAHRLAGATDQVARYRLGAALSDATPHLLLLSATPHSGKTEQFLRLMRLLDRDAFLDGGSLTQDRVRPYVVRTEKRFAIDNEGKPLFKPRVTRTETVEWLAKHDAHRRLYDAVSDYVRDGYNQSVASKQRHIGFLMVLMQRLVTSSTAAIGSTLTRRLEALAAGGMRNAIGPAMDDDDLAELDAQARLDALIDWPGWRSEKAEVEGLLSLTEEASGASDPKVDALVGRIRQIEADEGDPEVKVLIFTEFVPTQGMLARHLADRGMTVTLLNGQMSIDERVAAQDAFRSSARILISTDAGGEGLNLQFAHVVVNFDMPWNPMRIEQRIGRVDRIGQMHTVRAYNLQLADTVESRVRDVLETKLAAISKELGIDKASDVLDSVESEAAFDGVYMQAISDPARLEREADATLTALRHRIEEERANRELIAGHSILGPEGARAVQNHPIHFWLERAITSGIRERGGEAVASGDHWILRWPREERSVAARFTPGDAVGVEPITLQDERVRRLIDDMPLAGAGRKWRVTLSGLPAGVDGTWTLWRIGLVVGGRRRVKYAPMFLKDGRAFAPTARRIWDELLSRTDLVVEALPVEAETADERRMAEAQMEPLYRHLASAHLADLADERTRADEAFHARARAIGRIGLPNVRQHRRARLESERNARMAAIEASMATLPSFDLIASVQVAAS